MNCCNEKVKNRKGFLNGILFGLTAHSFCILFIILTALSASTLTAIVRPLFMSRYFFHALVLMAIVFATLSAVIYLKKNSLLSFAGIKEKRSYLLILYSTTITINLLFFIIIFPIAANVSGGSSLKKAVSSSFIKSAQLPLNGEEGFLILQTDIPCSGHAYLVFSDLNDFPGVNDINFRFPNIFEITYDKEITTTDNIMSVDVFQEYETTIIK